MSALDGKTKVKPHIRLYHLQPGVFMWVCAVNGNPRQGWGKTPEDAYYSWKNS